MSNITPDFQKIAKDLIKDAQTIAEVEMINFIMSNFENQSFTDVTSVPWEQRKSGADPGRALLVKSVSLRDSVKITESTPNRIVATADAKHASIHNEGGTITIPVTAKMKKWFWYMYKKTRDEKYKKMAFTKKKHFIIKMPKRQFMGDSKTFIENLEKKFFVVIAERFKQHLNSN